MIWDKVRDAEPLGARSVEPTIRVDTFATLWLGHLPSFDGSIGFRCVSDPMKDLVRQMWLIWTIGMGCGSRVF